jgi:uncharacterized protein (TIGR02001 family)
MKLANTSLACCGLLACASVAAEDELPIPGSFSANVAITTDYVFRGISQTDRNPAVQGGFDYDLPLVDWASLYLGIWGSNVDFGPADDSTVELDYYGGFKGTVAEIWGWDLGYIYYDYPSESVNDYWELYGKGSVDIMDAATLSAGIYYSNDFFANSDKAWYYEGGLDIKLPYEFGLGGHIGRQDFDSSDLQDYTDWKVGLSRPLVGFDLEFAYVDNNLSKSDCGNQNICDKAWVFTVSRSF